MPPSITPCAAPLGNTVKQCERCKSHYCRGRRSGQRTPEISYVKAAHILTRAGSPPPPRAAAPKLSPKKKAMMMKQAQRRSRRGDG